MINYRYLCTVNIYFCFIGNHSRAIYYSYAVPINGMPNASEFLTFLFADDTQRLAFGKNLPEINS